MRCGELADLTACVAIADNPSFRVAAAHPFGRSSGRCDWPDLPHDPWPQTRRQADGHVRFDNQSSAPDFTRGDPSQALSLLSYVSAMATPYRMPSNTHDADKSCGAATLQEPREPCQSACPT
jgi:hypothetical protein